MGARQIASVIHSMARLLSPNDEREGLLETMQRRATVTAGEFEPQGISMLLWALATMRERADRELLEAMQTRAMTTAGEFGPQAVANLLWALATMGEKADRKLLETMQSRATATAGEFKPQEVSNMLWALATMGERADRKLLNAMQRQATATAGEFDPQNVANVLWSLAVMDNIFNKDLTVLVDHLAARILVLRDQFSEAEKSQLHQWILACELGLASGASLPEGVALVKQTIGVDCLEAFSGQATHESQLQREVAAAVRSTGLKVEIEEEYRDARSGYSIDILVRRRSAAGGTGRAKSEEEPFAEWAVEVDGPSHFLGGSRTPSGNTLLKRRQLEQLGYTVVPVPFWEWDALRGVEAKRRCLVDKLGAC
ncbi:RAP domain-containing protein [Baffinella frigidus]|nr:RAP domain-containing protein [Cryptophyta sp. CCMP2293]